MRIRSVSKWTLASAIIGMFGMGAYSLYGEAVLADAEGRPLSKAQTPKYFLPVTAGLAAAVVTLTVL